MNLELFDCLLNWLDSDLNEAGRKYEAIRRDLIKYFSLRAAEAVAEELADKTINTVSQKAPDLITSYIGDPRHYIFRVANYKCLEYIRLRAQRDGGAITTDPPLPPGNDPEEKEILSSCLRECLGRLPKEERELFLHYYLVKGENQLAERKKLAELRNFSINALRLQIFRMKEKLRECITDCRERKQI